MSDSDRIRASKFLSLVLRHKPEELGIILDTHGWAATEEVIRLSANSSIAFTNEILEQIVSECEKQRFEFNEDRTKIRCRQGHSLSVELELPARQPPEILFHGTATRFLESILAGGLLKQQRQHVHLSPDVETATSVGSRYGRPVVLRVLAGKMFCDGHVFYLSENGVWLTDSVPAVYIER